MVVLFTVDEESNCLDGTQPEVAAQRVVAVGADAVGCNCSTGPAAVLSAVERMRAVTSLPIVAMPNAGMPRNVEGRNIYLTSPEYMGSFARKFVRAGASWVGGCCGTTPAHIRAMRSALRAMEAQDAGETAVARTSPAAATRDQRRTRQRLSRRRCASVRTSASASPTASSSPWWRLFRPRASTARRSWPARHCWRATAWTRSTCPTRRAPRRA